jgi:hypothetical protein
VTSKTPNSTAFDMGGGGSSKKKRKKAKPRPFRVKTKRDVVREVYRQAGILPQLKKLRNTPSDVKRLALEAGWDSRVIDSLSLREQQQLEADLSSIGILPGRTAGTLPERLVAKYLLGRGLPYEGMGYNAHLYQGWAFQLPTIGGRSGSGGGAVLDIAIAAKASLTGKIVAGRVNGSYWHHLPGAPAHDAAQKRALERAGYTVLDIWDYEATSPGVLDARMREVLR